MLRPDRDNDDDDKGTLHFDPWLTTQGRALCELADDIFNALPSPPVTPGRKPRADAVERRKAATHTVIANMAALSLHPVCTQLAIPTRNVKRTRYDRKGFNADVLRTILKAMEENDLLDITPAVFKERRTVLRLTPALAQRFAHVNVAVEDLGRAAGRETIELWEQTNEFGRKELVDYTDTEATISLHEQMDAINSAISKADIRYDGKSVLTPFLHRIYQKDSFGAEARFDLHGRLYGGFWETLNKEDRYRITLDGEELADLDYRAMFIMLAYVKAGAKPSAEEDPYVLSGLSEYRDVLKKMMVSLFFRSSEAKRLVKGVKDRLPEGFTMEQFKAAAKRKHPAIAHMFDTNVGFELMSLEADILVAVLLDLANQGRVALGMHDGMLVKRSERDIVMQTMSRVSADIIGWPLNVVEKAISRPAK